MTRGEASGEAPGGGDLRERILRASVQLIEEQGLAALSMREVARRAGVSHQAPYHHFADRETILGAIAEEGFRMLGDRLLAAVKQGPQPRPVSERIAACGQAYVDFACAHPAHFRVMFRPELVDITRCPGALDAGDRAFGCVTELIHEAVAEGLPAVPSEQALVAFAWSVGHGLACLILDGPLARRLPGAERDEQIRGVSSIVGSLIATAIAAAREKGTLAEPGSPARGARRR